MNGDRIAALSLPSILSPLFAPSKWKAWKYMQPLGFLTPDIHELLLMLGVCFSEREKILMCDICYSIVYTSTMVNFKMPNYLIVIGNIWESVGAHRSLTCGHTTRYNHTTRYSQVFYTGSLEFLNSKVWEDSSRSWQKRRLGKSLWEGYFSYQQISICLKK